MTERLLKWPLRHGFRYFSKKSQQVLVEGKCSDKLPILSGVPQSSVIAHRLFLAYKNDLPDSVKSRVGLFADDNCLPWNHLISSQVSVCPYLLGD